MARQPSRQKSSPPSPQDSGQSLPPFEREIDRQIGDLVPQQSRAQVVNRITSVLISEQFSGPIAHPRHLREYEEICKGAAERIISMAEKRNDHHISMERSAMDSEVSDRELGMCFGAVLFASLICSALVAALISADVKIVGAFLSAAAIGGVGLFIKGRQSSD